MYQTSNNRKSIRVTKTSTKPFVPLPTLLALTHQALLHPHLSWSHLLPPTLPLPHLRKWKEQHAGIVTELEFQTHCPTSCVPWWYLGAGQVPGHGSHNGLCPTCTDNGILHIIVACNGPQGAQNLLHKVLYGGHKGVT